MTKVRITPVVSYKIEVEVETDDGDEWREIGQYDKSSEWNGMIQLNHQQSHRTLIVQPFGKDAEKEYIANVVSATEGIFSKND